MKEEDIWQGFRYLLVGGLNSGLGLAMIAFFMCVLSLSPEFSNALAYGVGIVTSYLLNRNLTFRSTKSVTGELVRFFFVYVVAFLANFLTLRFFLAQTGANAFIAQLAAMAIFVLTSYSLQKTFVFRRDKFLGLGNE